MSKFKNIAVFSAMLVGVMIYTSPAKSAVCFLPDDDGSCGGGDIEISDNPTPVDQCKDFKLSRNQRDSKEYSSDCYTCESCTYNNRTTYKCSPKSGATWYDNLGICCTDGATYDSRAGKCCPAGGCADNCPEGKSWDAKSKSCKCNNGKDADGGICCADSEHVSDGICCPEKKHNENGKCVCDSQYNTDKDGNCVTQNNNQTCEDMGYESDNCSNSCERAYKTGVYDSDGFDCYRCEPYDCTKTCSEMNPLWVGEDTGCGKPTGGVGSYYTMEWIYDEAYEPIRGSDSDCGICHEKRGFYVSTKSSKCYKIVSITGEGVKYSSRDEYYVPYGTEITVTTQNNDPNSRYCGHADDDLIVNNSGRYSRRTRTFKIDDDFIAKNGIKSSRFDMAIEDDVSKITYTALVELYEGTRMVDSAHSTYNDPDYYCESYVDITVNMDDASKDSFMDGSYLYIDINYSYIAYILDGIKYLGGEYSPSGGAYSFDGTSSVLVKGNTIDDTGSNKSLYLLKSTKFKLNFQGKQIILKYDGSNKKCIQLGTEEDNTEFCYEFDDWDDTSC